MHTLAHSRWSISSALRIRSLPFEPRLFSYAVDEESVYESKSTKPRFIHPSAIVHPNAAVIGEPGDVCYLEVGHNNDIREHTSIHRSSKISDKTIRSLRSAYKKIFMCDDDASAGSFAERLTEVERCKEFIQVPAVRAMLRSVRAHLQKVVVEYANFRYWNGS